jgi:hypothetical protein
MFLQSYLGGRTHFVKRGMRWSSAGGVTPNAAQVSVLCPLLSISYIDTVSGVTKYCQFHIYANDLQIYRSSNISDLDECYDKLNFDLERIHE